MREDVRDRTTEALQIAADYGTIDGAHHKMWVIDQMVRVLTSCPAVEHASCDFYGNTYTYQELGESDAYREFTASRGDWDEGIAP